MRQITLIPSTAPVAMAMRTRRPHMMMDWGSTCTHPKMPQPFTVSVAR